MGTESKTESTINLKDEIADIINQIQTATALCHPPTADEKAAYTKTHKDKDGKGEKYPNAMGILTFEEQNQIKDDLEKADKMLKKLVSNVGKEGRRFEQDLKSLWSKSTKTKDKVWGIINKIEEGWALTEKGLYAEYQKSSKGRKVESAGFKKKLDVYVEKKKLTLTDDKYSIA